jgi:hypothetical protein
MFFHVPSWLLHGPLRPVAHILLGQHGNRHYFSDIWKADREKLAPKNQTIKHLVSICELQTKERGGREQQWLTPKPIFLEHHRNTPSF